MRKIISIIILFSIICISVCSCGKKDATEIKEQLKDQLEENLNQITNDFMNDSNKYIFDIDSKGYEFIDKVCDFQSYNSYMCIMLGSGLDKSYNPYSFEDLCELYVSKYEVLSECYNKALIEIEKNTEVKILAKNYIEKCDIVYQAIKDNKISVNCGGEYYQAADDTFNIYYDFLDSVHK